MAAWLAEPAIRIPPVALVVFRASSGGQCHQGKASVRSPTMREGLTYPADAGYGHRGLS